ncbi:MAG TPA: hypothetical protein VLT84_11700 [Acidobacteriota bacterium]|nr:hypothetical protein [Acidobacteriota bacterium]
MTPRRSAVRAGQTLLALLTLLALAAWSASPRPAAAQTTDSRPGLSGLSEADSLAVAAAMAASDSAAAAATRAILATDADRFEFGVATPEDYFDWLGTFGYRRRLSVDPRFEHWLHLEFALGHKEYLTEGATSAFWFIRPRVLTHRSWQVRPVIEGGVGTHLVVQFADLVGFDDWASHSRAFVKGHGVVGLETNFAGRLGLALRGRITIPSHRPLDYAQLVLFLK